VFGIQQIDSELKEIPSVPFNQDHFPTEERGNRQIQLESESESIYLHLFLAYKDIHY
jgi:hypothetical protein